MKQNLMNAGNFMVCSQMSTTVFTWRGGDVPILLSRPYQTASTSKPVRTAVEPLVDFLTCKFLNEDAIDSLNSTPEILFTAIEKAYWEYMDKYRAEDKKLPNLSFTTFSKIMFNRNTILRPEKENVFHYVKRFQKLKRSIPTAGGALFNSDMNKVVLVHAAGKGGCWGFPKGKVEPGESMEKTAVRELEEEIGFDASGVITDSTPYIEKKKFGGLKRFYILKGIPEDTHLSTRIPEEISDIKWVHVSELPKSASYEECNRIVTLYSVGSQTGQKTSVRFSRQTFGVHMQDLQEALRKEESFVDNS